MSALSQQVIKSMEETDIMAVLQRQTQMTKRPTKEEHLL